MLCCGQRQGKGPAGGVAPRGLAHTDLEVTVDEIRISPEGEGFHAAARGTNHTHDEQEECGCFFCLEGWVFLGSVDHDGGEVFEAIRCRKCGGTGRIEDL